MSAIDTDGTDDRPVQSGEDPNAGEFLRLKRELIDAETHRGKWRKEAQECYDFVAGHQWSEEDAAILAAQNRPAVSFNRTAPLVKAVCGLEVNNRQGVIYLPRTQGVVGVNEMITNAGKWVRDECNAEDEESTAFRDLTISGEGWTEDRMDFDEDPMGKIMKERIDPLEMGVNKGASRANYLDARMIYRIREMYPDDIRALLGLADSVPDSALDAKWLDRSITPEDGGAGNKKDYPDETPDRVRSSSRGGKRKTVTVIQCQYWKREPMHLVATANDETPQTMTPEEFETFKARADAMNAAALEAGEESPMQYETTNTTKKVFYECFIGLRILDVRPMKLGRFQFCAMTGEYDRKKKCFYGMVRDMLDPQRWGNKFLAQTMHHINVNAKGGLLAETDAFVDVKKAEKDWSDPTKIVWVKPGTLSKQKIKERTAIPLPPGLDQLMLFAISSIRDVSGINLELLGQADREQAASLEQQRRQSAMTILATMFDSLRKYRKISGRLLLHFIWMLPEGTLIRVLDKGQYQYIPLMREGMEIEKFDVIIDEAPNSPDQKQFVWAITAQILQMNILPAPAIIELLKYSPYPESVVQEIRKALGVDGEMPPEQLKQRLDQAEQALQVVEKALHEAEEKTKEAEDDRSIQLLKIQVDEYKAETERLKAQWDARVKEASAIAAAADGGENATVTTGEQQLPALGDSSGASAPSALEQKVDDLAGMIQQLMQSLQPPQEAMESAPPPAGIPEESNEVGEM